MMLSIIGVLAFVGLFFPNECKKIGDILKDYPIETLSTIIILVLTFQFLQLIPASVISISWLITVIIISILKKKKNA